MSVACLSHAGVKVTKFVRTCLSHAGVIDIFFSVTCLCHTVVIEFVGYLCKSYCSNKDSLSVICLSHAVVIEPKFVDYLPKSCL